MKLIVAQFSHTLVMIATRWSPVHGAFITRSALDNQWVTGLARYAPLRRLMTVSTAFYDATNAIGVDGMINTYCEVLSADVTGHWVQFPLENPQLCVGGVLILQDNDGVGVIVGMDGNQTKLYNINEIGLDTPTPGATHTILEGKIPVAVDFGNPEDDYVYVAMHDIGDDIVSTGFGTDRVSSLMGMMSYWEKYTNPVLLAQGTSNKHVPYITKLKPSTGEVGWLGIYEVIQGSATIAAMTYVEFSLIACGSTNGSGDTVGYDEDGDWDGYVTFLNPVTGNVDMVFVDPDTGLSEDRGHIRIQSDEGGKNDYVNDMCLIGTDNLYVVGTTDGVFAGGSPGGAFVVKIDIQRRAIVEQLQLSGSDKTGLKIACSDTHVYVGGHVIIEDTSTLQEQQNIYVASYDAALSEMQWSVEIDTTPYYGEPRRNQLVELEFNPAGDVNVLLNSQVLATGVNDIIFMDLQGGTGANEIQKGATAGSIGGLTDDTLDGIEPVAGNSDGANDIDNEMTDIQKEEKRKRIVISLSVTIPVVVALAIGIYTLMGHRETKKEKVPVTPDDAVATAGSDNQHLV